MGMEMQMRLLGVTVTHNVQEHIVEALPRTGLCPCDDLPLAPVLVGLVGVRAPKTHHINTCSTEQDEIG